MVDSERDRLEAIYTSSRARELAVKPVEGNFDAAHLREINRRLFQDLPALGYTDVTPGEYRPPVAGHGDWYKMRSLEGVEAYSTVAYSRMDDAAKREIDRTLDKADPDRLQHLNTAAFTREIADLYTRLDYLHPFPDGNSRTLRAFTEQLADESGFDLDWSRFAQSEGGRSTLYVARDLSVNRLALSEIRSHETQQKVTLTLDMFEGNRDLGDLLDDAIRPNHAIAFEQLAQVDALAAFPELGPAYAVLGTAQEYAKAKLPDNAEGQAQFEASVRARIQDTLDAGERVESTVQSTTQQDIENDQDHDR